MLDALLGVLGTIGDVPVNWRTLSATVDGRPPDPVPFPDKPRIYVQWTHTDPTDAEAGMSTHGWRVSYMLWIVAASDRLMLNAKADVMQALFASEGTVAFGGMPFWIGGFETRQEMANAGLSMGTLVVWMDTIINHAAP